MKIIVPIGFFGSGLSFLKRLSKEVILTHVIEIMPLSNHWEVKEDIKKKLDKIARNLEEKGLETKTIVRLGSPGLDVARIAERERADMIVVPVAKGFKRHIYGSLTSSVLTFSKRPVLVVKEGFYGNAFEKPIIALPLNDPEFCLHMLHVLEGIKSMIKSAVFYHAGEHNGKLEYYAKKLGLPYELLEERRKGSLAKQILKAAASVRASSIIIGRKERLLDSIIMLGTAATVVRKSQVPVLVIPRVKKL